MFLNETTLRRQSQSQIFWGEDAVEQGSRLKRVVGGGGIALQQIPNS